MTTKQIGRGCGGAAPAKGQVLSDEELIAGQYSSPAAKASLLSAAAAWLVEQGNDAPRPVVPELRRRFGLTACEAVEAIKLANRLRVGGAS